MDMVRGIETREFGFGDVLQGGWAVWRAHPAVILAILLTFYVPSNRTRGRLLDIRCPTRLAFTAMGTRA